MTTTPESRKTPKSRTPSAKRKATFHERMTKKWQELDNAKWQEWAEWEWEVWFDRPWPEDKKPHANSPQADIDAYWGITPDMSDAQRREVMQRWSWRMDEPEDDEEASEREKQRLRALRADAEFATMMSQRGLEDMPTAVRKLYRQNPNNPKIRQLYDTVMREVHDRAEDKLRGALLPAVDRMVELLDSGDEKVALRAAVYIYERLAGRTPDVIEHRQDKPFQVVLERLSFGPRIAGEPRTALPSAEDVLDAEVVSTGLTDGNAEISQVEVQTAIADYAEEEELMAGWERIAREVRQVRKPKI